MWGTDVGGMVKGESGSADESVAIESRIVVIQDVVVSGVAVGFDGTRATIADSSHYSRTPGWCLVGTRAVGAADCNHPVCTSCWFRVADLDFRSDWQAVRQALPLPSLYQMSSANPNMMWLAPVPPITA